MRVAILLIIAVAILTAGCSENAEKNCKINSSKIELIEQENERLREENNRLKNEITQLIEEKKELKEEVNKLESELKYSLSPPYITVKKRQVFVYFKKTNGEIAVWEVPFESLERSVIQGYLRREFIPDYYIPLMKSVYESFLSLCVYSDCEDLTNEYQNAISELKEKSIQYVELMNENGKKVTVIDYRPFVVPDVFKQVIPDLYRDSKSDKDFIKEIWNIVTQLTAYSTEEKETPRYPLETLLAGGGDCEDLSILFASMIKAAPVNWKVYLVYMDANNPSNPEEVNHVIICIETGKETYLIETTNRYLMEPYEKVTGWYLEI
jgi:cell division protein FtsB